MDLLVAILNEDDAPEVIEALAANGYTATRINTASGLLKMPNVTLLIGVDSDQTDKVINIIRDHCHPHEAPVPPPSLWSAEPGPTLPKPIEVPISRAVIFALGIKRYERL